MNIYQLFPRLFGNKNTEIHFDGDKSENGCGTFADIDETALNAIKNLGITHIWLTGILRHATAGETHPDITKGKAGSPYAVTDYYDIDHDLGTFADLEALVNRIHSQGMNVIIDFIPNHLARECKGFDAQNFYILEGQDFVAPTGNGYKESPAKATGNDVFSPTPSINDWYDTIKLNYNEHDTWEKMLNILRFWCKKGIDGFRIDMAEMVPVEFWQWAIAELRKDYQPILIAEIYQPALYQPFIDAGFDFLYDKVGLYNTLENIMRNGLRADSITQVWKDLNGLDDKMLRFMENHDEVRLASPHFVGNAFDALPAVALAALMNKGPFMIYNGQENGEQALDAQGYSGDDGRTSIFDYTNMPNHQLWMNGGLFDGEKCDAEQKKLFGFYARLLNFRNSSKAISEGAFYDLMWCNPWYNNFDPEFVYAFLRYTEKEHLLIVVNFNRNECRDIQIKIPEDALQLMGFQSHNDFGMSSFNGEHLQLHLEPSEVKIIDFDTKENLL